VVPTIKRPINITEGRFNLREVSFEIVKRFASKGAKERVSISNTQNTLWFAVSYRNNIIGVCGLYLAKNKCRIKGDYLLPEYRGKGIGEFITISRMSIIKSLGYANIEVLTLHPQYYAKIGFNIHKETRKGIWYGTKRLDE
tara:strand:+ start:845 stop:1267 length:423 start_codon:yes stop_codon:yes gene_type:complete